MFSQLIQSARDHGASDLHLEAGLPAAIRVRGVLHLMEPALDAKTTLGIAQSLLSESQWARFAERRSFDLARTIQGVRCRVNVLQTARGVGLAVRLLPSTSVTVETLNLHPDFRRLVQAEAGLLIVTGATGSGKSSTVAALVEEINQSEPRHVVSIESPIEFLHRPRRAYVRQREVGRDTPSFEQALVDALREDPDVLVVGEMRDPETMRLTLNAAETGHLVITTMHSSTGTEALQRYAASFPPEIQSAVRAQLADCLLGVLAQRLRYRTDLRMRVPECELILPSHAVRSHIRTGDFHKILSSVETGAEHGMWTFARYGTWLEARKTWHHPPPPGAAADDPEPKPLLPESLSSVPRPRPAASSIAAEGPAAPSPAAGATPRSGRIEIEPVEGGLGEVLRRLGPP
jgi:twitching motility protein PilT